MSILKVFLKLYCLLPSFCEHPSPVYLYGIAFTYHILNISLFLNPNHPPGQNGYSDFFVNSKFFRGCKPGSLKEKGVLQRPPKPSTCKAREFYYLAFNIQVRSEENSRFNSFYYFKPCFITLFFFIRNDYFSFKNIKEESF